MSKKSHVSFRCSKCKRSYVSKNLNSKKEREDSILKNCSEPCICGAEHSIQWKMIFKLNNNL